MTRRPTDDEAASDLQALAEDVEALHTALRATGLVDTYLTDAARLLRLAEQHYEHRRVERLRRGTGVRGQWYVTHSAVQALLRLDGYEGDPDDPDDPGYRQAEWTLIDLSRIATLRQRDAVGREQWRVGRPYQLRMIVDPRPQPGGGDDQLPRLIWVGKGRAPETCWESEDRAQAVPGGRRER